MNSRSKVPVRPFVALLLGLGILAFASGCASTAAAPAAPPPPPVVGTWNLTIETPIGTQTPKFVVSGTAAALEGILSSEQGDVTVQGMTFADGELKFGMDIDAGGQQLHLDFTGMVDGDSINGSFASDFGDIPVTGTRAP